MENRWFVNIEPEVFMKASQLDKKIREAAAKVRPLLKKAISEEDLHLILWNLFRVKKDPGDFLLKPVGKNRWAR
jgi:hypothetical protein